jgi:dihydrofolate synthase / folylpolyglutamate synthase
MTKPTSSRRGGRARKSGSAASITSYSTAVRYLYDRVDIERMRIIRYDEQLFKLDRIRKLLKELGNPHEQIRTIHVAGTVGKGSTVAMLASMLEGCDYTVGEFTSPHMIDVRERITINGKMTSRPEFTDLMKQVSRAAKRAGVEPTFFEIMTAAGFKHFADQAVDVAIVEVGLGGRLDSTNVITPLASLITTIDYDHMHLLGGTLPKIAREKAGIMKKGVPVITIEQEEPVEQTLRECAREAGTTLKVINKEIEFSSRFGASADLGPHTRVCLLTEKSQYMHIPVPLPGEHQAGNCGLALAVIDLLKDYGFEFPEVALHEGLAATRTPGRMELAWDQPRILIDGAHNPAAISALMRCVGAHVPYDSMVCIFGCCEDKDIPAMLDRLALGGDKVIFTKARGNARAADPDDLQREFQQISGKMNQVAPTLAEALDLASRAVGRDDLIVITGSFYLVGEAKKYLAELEKKRANSMAAG